MTAVTKTTTAAKRFEFRKKVRQVFLPEIKKIKPGKTGGIDDRAAAGNFKKLCLTGGMLTTPDFIADRSGFQREARLDGVKQ